jgi:glycosyltransferase involved in cell wall biosynthesis
VDQSRLSDQGILSNKGKQPLIIGAVTDSLPYLPARDGFRVYEANILANLAKSHDVHLISLLRLGDDEHLAWARRHFASVTTIVDEKHSLPSRVASFACTYYSGRPLHYRSSFSKTISDQSSSQKWNVLHVAGEFVGGLIPPTLKLPMVLSLHDAYSLRCRQIAELSTSTVEKFYYRLLVPLEERYARKTFHRFSKCVYVADADLEVARSLGVSNAAVISNGVDTSYFTPTDVPIRTNTIIFHGNLSYPPNVRAVQDMIAEVMPVVRREIPEVVFRVVGATPDPKVLEFSRQGLIELISSPADIRPSLEDGAVYACGVRFGTGLKNKLLEAMSMGKAIVSYEEAVSGIRCTNDEHMIIVKTPESFAASILELLKNEKLRNRLGSAARQLVLKEFSWSSRALEFENLYLNAKNV